MLNKEICKKCYIDYYCNIKSQDLSDDNKKILALINFERNYKSGYFYCFKSEHGHLSINNEKPPLECIYYLEQILTKKEI